MQRFREYWLPVTLGLLAVGIAFNFMLLVPALGTLSDQANDGRLAHQRQCRLYPVSTKLFLAARKYGLITRHDLETYLRFQPKGC